MKTRLLLLSVCLFGFFLAQGQGKYFPVDSFIQRCSNQSEVFPQEKVYIHTDRPYYLKGDTIWFRAYLVDASSLRPVTTSRYVYVELTTPLDSTVTLSRIMADKGIYAGYLPLSVNLAEGNYTLSGYTMYMNNQGSDYLFRKKIPVMNAYPPVLQTKVDFRKNYSERGLIADVSFQNMEGIKQKAASLYCQVDGKNVKTTPVNRDSTWRIDLPPASRLLRIQSENYRKYLSLPLDEETYDVAFFPEGGYLIEDTVCGLAFKALNPQGMSEDICGKLFDNHGTEVLTFQSIHAGMGFFYFKPERGKLYHVVCQNASGIKRQFELPAARTDTYSIKSTWTKNRLLVSVLCPPNEQPGDSLMLFIHAADRLVYASQWDFGSAYISVEKADFPLGISEILLLDQAGNTLSKRLVFCRDDSEQPQINTDKKEYETRERVNVEVSLPGIPGVFSPGSFSVSVTDNTKIQPDSCQSIQAYLLLQSELKGNIESPGYYFGKNDRETTLALDALMMTQGWTRYHIPEAVKSNYKEPEGYLEIGQEISGTVTTRYRKKPVKGVQVFIMAKEQGYADVALTDKNGRFCFNGFNYPENTRYELKVFGPNGSLYTILLDKEFSAESSCSMQEQSVPSDTVKIIPDNFENGSYGSDLEKLIVNLDEVVVKGKKKELPVNVFQTLVAQSFDSDYLEKNIITSIDEILRKVAGVSFDRGKVYLSARSTPAVFCIDGVLMDDPVETMYRFSKDNSGNAKSTVSHSGVAFDYTMIPVQDIERVEIIKPWNSTIFGTRAMGGVIMITTKKGVGKSSDRDSGNTIKFVPLGFQKPVEFYSPKYETKEQKKNDIPDLRKTVYWNPNVSVSKEGKASFDFYTSDLPSGYTLTIEGVLDDGKIISATHEIVVKLE